jgi:hydroxyethylthiazole kinase
MGASESVPVVKESLEVPRSPLAGKAAAYIRRVRQAGPLVHCFSNYVAMDLMANALLAAGASPAMVHSEDECADFTRGPAAALLVNMGTYSPSWAAGMRKSIAAANETGKPWVLDPVGCGATPARTKVTVELARLGPTAIRGNASEILALAKAVLGELPPSDEEVAAAEAAKRKAAKKAAAAAGGDGGDSDSDGDSSDSDSDDDEEEASKNKKPAPVTADGPKGVDSVNTPAQALPAAKALAAALGTVVGVTGAVDVVTDGSYTLYVANGVELCTKVTGAGCALTAIVAAFLTARPAGKHHHKKEAAAAADDAAAAASAKKDKKSKKDKKGGDKDGEGGGVGKKGDEADAAATTAAEAAPPTPRGETVVAVASALAYFGMAAQIALQLAREAEEKTYSWETRYGGVPTVGPATLRVGLVDQLHRLSRALASAAVADSERFTRDLGLHSRKLSDSLLLSTDGAWAADTRRVLDTANDTVARNAIIAAGAAPAPAAPPAEGGAT